MYWPSNDTRSKAADFQDNLVKPVPECQATVDFSAATDDGNGCIVTTGTLTDSKIQSEHYYYYYFYFFFTLGRYIPEGV